MDNAVVVIKEAGTVYPFVQPELTPFLCRSYLNVCFKVYIYTMCLAPVLEIAMFVDFLSLNFVLFALLSYFCKNFFIRLNTCLVKSISSTAFYPCYIWRKISASSLFHFICNSDIAFCNL